MTREAEEEDVGAGDAVGAVEKLRITKTANITANTTIYILMRTLTNTPKSDSIAQDAEEAVVVVEAGEGTEAVIPLLPTDLGPFTILYLPNRGHL